MPAKKTPVTGDGSVDAKVIDDQTVTDQNAVVDGSTHADPVSPGEAPTPAEAPLEVDGESAPPVRKARPKQLVKYMGSADRSVLLKGHDFNGQLGQGGLENNVVFDHSNRFVVDVKALGLSDESIELLLADTERFLDVTSLKRIPANQNQRIFG